MSLYSPVLYSVLLIQKKDNVTKLPEKMKQQIPFEYSNKLQWTEQLVMGNCNVRQCQLCDDMMVCLDSSWKKVDPMQPSP